ncbi:transposable element Tcb1 transposase [Trichonephila clavipes]|nr:transposable element Tcb1 transposase [Trichonephila clavipes]
MEVSEELEIKQSVISWFWQQFEDDGNVSRRYIVRTPNEDRYLALTAKKKKKEKQTEHSFRSILSAIYSQGGAIRAEFVFMEEHYHLHRVKIVNECFQSEDITCVEFPVFSLDLNPTKHVWDILGRRVACSKPTPTCVPEFRRVLLAVSGVILSKIKAQ